MATTKILLASEASKLSSILVNIIFFFFVDIGQIQVLIACCIHKKFHDNSFKASLTSNHLVKSRSREDVADENLHL